MCSGGSQGDARDARPLGGRNSFNFMQFLGKFVEIVCQRPLGSWCPFLREILDQPLMCLLNLLNQDKNCIHLLIPFEFSHDSIADFFYHFVGVFVLLAFYSIVIQFSHRVKGFVFYKTDFKEM